MVNRSLRIKKNLICRGNLKNNKHGVVIFSTFVKVIIVLNRLCPFNQFIIMRKADLVNAIAEKTGVAKVDVLVTLEEFFQQVKGNLADGENVYIRGFGSFIIKKRAAKVGRHIKRNEAIVIPEHYIPSFKPAKTFVDEVKEKVKSLPEDK